MPTLAIDRGFLSDLVKLEKPVAKRVTQVFDEFDTATHTGLHLQKINNAGNARRDGLMSESADQQCDRHVQSASSSSTMAK
jgi:hypothetical protein